MVGTRQISQRLLRKVSDWSDLFIWPDWDVGIFGFSVEEYWCCTEWEVSVKFGSNEGRYRKRGNCGFLNLCKYSSIDICTAESFCCDVLYYASHPWEPLCSGWEGEGVTLPVWKKGGNPGGDIGRREIGAYAVSSCRFSHHNANRSSERHKVGRVALLDACVACYCHFHLNYNLFDWLTVRSLSSLMIFGLSLDRTKLANWLTDWLLDWLIDWLTRWWLIDAKHSSELDSVAQGLLYSSKHQSSLTDLTVHPQTNKPLNERRRLIYSLDWAIHLIDSTIHSLDSTVPSFLPSSIHPFK